jgi:hypothetical protein
VQPGAGRLGHPRPTRFKQIGRPFALIALNATRIPGLRQFLPPVGSRRSGFARMHPLQVAGKAITVA